MLSTSNLEAEFLKELVQGLTTGWKNPDIVHLLIEVVLITRWVYPERFSTV